MERKHAIRTDKWEFPTDTAGNRVDAWFLHGVEENGVHQGEEVMFTAHNVHGYGNLKLHSVSETGEVNASVLITGAGYNGNPQQQYHEFVILDGWPEGYYKVAGESYIRKKQ